MKTALSAACFVASAVVVAGALYYDIWRGKVAVAGGFGKFTYVERRLDPLLFWGAISLKATILLAILYFVGANLMRTSS